MPEKPYLPLAETVGGIPIHCAVTGGAPGRWAASELRRCLEPFARELRDRLGIREITLTVEPGARDAYRCTPTPSGMQIAGSSPGCLVTGVFRWLESLGWGWYYPGAAGERVPQRLPAALPGAAAQEAAFSRRGVVFRPGPDLAQGWADYCARSGLNVLAVHDFWDPDSIAALRRALNERGIALEFELHALGHLLPREEFARHPEWFRMDARGQRTPEYNLCPSQPEALRVAAEHAVDLVASHRPDTSRYFLWADDGAPWCACPRCATLSPAEQNLLVMNALAEALLRVDGGAQVACLAYCNSLTVPVRVRPAENIFLEYAPIRRCWAHLLDDPACAVNAEHRSALLAQVEAFPAGQRQALEYWLDLSLFSHWRDPFVRLPDLDRLLPVDLRCYQAAGIEAVTSFAVGLDLAYYRQYSSPATYAYPRLLWNPAEDPMALRRRFCAGALGCADALDFYSALDSFHALVFAIQQQEMPADPAALAAELRERAGAAAALAVALQTDAATARLNADLLGAVDFAARVLDKEPPAMALTALRQEMAALLGRAVR